MRKLAFLGLIFIAMISSCTVQHVFPFVKTSEPVLTKFKDKIFFVYVSPKVVVTDFKKTYSEKFGTGDVFSEHLAKTLSIDLSQKAKVVTDTIITKELQNLDINATYGSSDFDNKVKSFAADKGINFLITLENLKLGSVYTHSTGYMGPNGMMTGGSTSETCTIEGEFKILDLETNKVVESFRVIGTENVFLFAFESALMNTVKTLSKRAVAYISSGKTKF